MEKIGATNPAIARKTILLASFYPFTKQMVPSLCPESLTLSLSKSFSSVFRRRPIKCFLPSITFLHARHFFLCFHFHRTLFCGLAGACVNPGSIFSNSLFVYSLTHFLMDFSQTCVSTYALPIILISA